MSVPNLSRALVLENPVTGPDGAGGFTTIWQPLGTHWCDIRAGAGRARQGSMGPMAEQGLRITLRAAPLDSPRRPRPDQRFREGARLFRILSVTEADAQGRWLVCTAQEETPA